MTADFRLVTDAAETDSDIFSVQSLCYAPAETSLASSGRSDKQQDGTLVVFLQLHNGKVLQDTFLDFIQSVVVGIQDFLGPIQVDILCHFLLPRKLQHEVQVVADDALLGAAGALHFQLLNLFQSGFFDFLRHAGCFDTLLIVIRFSTGAGAEGGTVISAALSELLLDGLQLLTEHLFAVILVGFLRNSLIELHVEFNVLLLLHHKVNKVKAAFAEGVGL